MGVEADAARLGRSIWWLGDGKVRHIVAGPALAVPPHPFFSFAPRFAIEIGRGAVVHQAAVGGPSVAPIQLGAGLPWRIGLFARGEIFIRRRKDAAVDPRGTGGRAIIL